VLVPALDPVLVLALDPVLLVALDPVPDVAPDFELVVVSSAVAVISLQIEFAQLTHAVAC